MAQKFVTKLVDTRTGEEYNLRAMAKEVVTIQLSTEDGATHLVAGVEIAVKVEGETEERFYHTDDTGKVQFRVDHGLQYTIAFPAIEGYHELGDITYRAALPVRTINEVYRKDETLAYEHVIVTLRYQDGGASRATQVNYIIGGSSDIHSAPVVNSVAEFDIPLGSTYRVEFASVDTYATPHAHQYFAEAHTRNVYAYYISASTGLSWVKKDGTTIEYNDVTSEMKGDLLGLRVATSTLISWNSAFVVPLDYLLGEKVLGSMAWCTKNEGFSSIPSISSASEALKPANVDGYNNTILVLEEAAANGRTVPAFTGCHDLEFVVGGQTLRGFLGSYAQMKAFSDNIQNVTGLCYQVFGKYAITVNSGNWWTSTQYSAAGAVPLGYGGWSNNSKTNSTSVVPLLAY